MDLHTKDWRWEFLLYRKPPLFHIKTPWFKYSIGYMLEQVREGRRMREVIRPVHALTVSKVKTSPRRRF